MKKIEKLKCMHCDFIYSPWCEEQEGECPKCGSNILVPLKK